MKRLTQAKAGNWEALDAYLRDIRRLCESDNEKDAALAAKACSGDLQAREKLVSGNLALVVKIARHYCGYGLPLADMVSEGNLGLIRASELFDPAYGTKFKTYASFWIKQRIHRLITNQSKIVRLPVWKSQRLRKLARLHTELTAKLGREPETAELASRMGLTSDEVEHIFDDRLDIQSLHSPVSGDGGGELGEKLVDEKADCPSSGLTRQELASELAACLKDLTEKELEVLTLKYGLDGSLPRSFRRMSTRFGQSREWLRRIAEGALSKMRRSIKKNSGQYSLAC